MRNTYTLKARLFGSTTHQQILCDMLGSLRRFMEPHDRTSIVDIEAPRYSYPSEIPFNGFSVPDEVTRDPADSQIYAELAEHLLIAPGREPDTLVVFPINLDARDREDGERVSESYLDEDDAEHVEHRLDCARRIYAHLFADGAAHPRIASYRGPTATGYKLQRLRPGPLMHMAGLQPARTSAKLLALYQRWAVQVLSALVFLHSKGVILNTISDEVLWLRDDLSIAIAGLVDAACSAVGVPAGCSAGISCFGNPWEATNHYTPEGLLERSASSVPSLLSPGMTCVGLECSLTLRQLDRSRDGLPEKGPVRLGDLGVQSHDTHRPRRTWVGNHGRVREEAGSHRAVGADPTPQV